MNRGIKAQREEQEDVGGGEAYEHDSACFGKLTINVERIKGGVGGGDGVERH